MSDLEWKFCGSPENPRFKCRKCGKRDNIYFMEDDGDHEDVQYWCKDCGHRWWIEGSDY